MRVASNNNQDTLSIDNQDVEDVVNSVLELECREYDEVSITFVDEPTIAQLHDEYFDDPSVTDCISFPFENSESEYRVLGDVIVCPSVAKTYVNKHGGDLKTETTLYLVHGLLHLLGYDDIEEGDREKMRAAEARHMERLTQLGKGL